MPKSKISERHQYKLAKVKEVLKILSLENQICFRGGTALSLSYEIIERFSEDIDISIFKGPKKIKKIVNWMIKEFKNLSWVVKTDHQEKKRIIELHFINEKPAPRFNHLFSDNKISIEYPKVERLNNSFNHSLISPFKNADFKINVMNKEHIFADKAAILIEKFSEKEDFSWAIDDRASVRHLYDVQMLIQKEKYKRVEEAYILKRAYQVTIRKNYTLRGNDEKIRKTKMLFYKKSQKEAFQLFKTQLLNKQTEITKKIKLLVYPGADLLNLRMFLANYEPIFRLIFKTIKNELNKSILYTP